MLRDFKLFFHAIEGIEQQIDDQAGKLNPIVDQSATANQQLPWIPSESNDFVFRWQVSDVSSGTLQNHWFQSVLDRLVLPDPKDRFSSLPYIFEDEARVVFQGHNPQQEVTEKVRVLLSPAGKQRQIVGSIRYSGTKKTPKHSQTPPLHKGGVFRVLVEQKVDKENPEPNNEQGDPNTPEREKPVVKKKVRVGRQDSKFVFSPDAVCDVVLKRLGLVRDLDGETELSFPKDWDFDKVSDGKVNTSPSGVIVVAGGTGTGKSTYARGLVLRYLIRLAISRLKKLKSDKKNLSEFDPPHLVTFEDPIEDWTINAVHTSNNAPISNNDQVDTIDLLADAEADLKCGIRLTSRAKKFDVDDLNSATMHALRQKPTIVYIGECREAKDWNLALELGGTGHLVVTTCHASSLVDTFVKLAGPGSRDAQGRQFLASSLCGVLHLKTGRFASKKVTKFKEVQTFFSLWRNTPESVSNFVADGLASLVIDGDNVLSRSGLSEEILKYQEEDRFELSLGDVGTQGRKDFYKNLTEVVLENAFALDLELV